MKIAMCVPSWPPEDSASGIVTYASYMVPALRRLGHEVFVLARSSKTADSQINLIEAFRKPIPHWNRALFRLAPTNAMYHADAAPLVSAVRALLTEHKIDILEIEESYGLSYALTRLGQIPVVVRLHGPWFLTKTFEDSSREHLERRAIVNAHGVTSPSRHTLRSVERKYGKQLKHALAFGNPIEIPSSEWLISDCDVNRLLFIGRFDKLKGADLVIKAFGKLAENNPRLTLTFVGPDRGINGMKIFEYARRELSPEVLSRFDFRGQLSPGEIDKLRTKHFATVCASRFEVFGYTVLEALASGCPVIASDVGGIPEIVCSGENGILFDSESSDNLISSAQMLLDSPRLAEQLGRAARHSVFQYRPDTIASIAVEFYEQTITNFRDAMRKRNRFKSNELK